MSFLFFDPIRFRTIVMDQFLVLHFIQYPKISLMNLVELIEQFKKKKCNTT